MLEESARGRRYAAIGLALAIGLFLGTLASAAFQYDFQQTLQWVSKETETSFCYCVRMDVMFHDVYIGVAVLHDDWCM